MAALNNHDRFDIKPKYFGYLLQIITFVVKKIENVAVIDDAGD